MQFLVHPDLSLPYVVFDRRMIVSIDPTFIITVHRVFLGIYSSRESRIMLRCSSIYVRLALTDTG